MFEQKCPWNQSSFAVLDILKSLIHGSWFSNSSKISRISLSCVDSKDKLLHLYVDEFSGDDALLQSAGGETDIMKEF